MNHGIRFVLAACAALAVAACDERGAAGDAGAKGESAVQKRGAAGRGEALHDSLFALDLSTPDRALRTYWRIKSLADTLGAPIDTSSALAKGWERADSTLGLLYAGSALEAYRRNHQPHPRQQYAREILEVRQETASRAVVTARVRNVTPIPPGVTPDGYEAERRQNGEVYRYVLENDGQGWKLVQVQSAQMDYMGDSTWSNYFQPSDVMVPTWTYP